MGLCLTVVGDNGETELVGRETHVFGEAGDVGIPETNIHISISTELV